MDLGGSRFFAPGVRALQPKAGYNAQLGGVDLLTYSFCKLSPWCALKHWWMLVKQMVGSCKKKKIMSACQYMGFFMFFRTLCVVGMGSLRTT